MQQEVVLLLIGQQILREVGVVGCQLLVDLCQAGLGIVLEPCTATDELNVVALGDPPLLRREARVRG